VGATIHVIASALERGYGIFVLGLGRGRGPGVLLGEVLLAIAAHLIASAVAAHGGRVVTATATASAHGGRVVTATATASAH